VKIRSTLECFSVDEPELDDFGDELIPLIISLLAFQEVLFVLIGSGAVKGAEPLEISHSSCLYLADIQQGLREAATNMSFFN
jgi:hypothetical protein